MYSLLATIDKTSLNPGDTVIVDVYIYGKPGYQLIDHKIIVHVPPAIVKDKIEITSYKFASSPEWEFARPVLPPQKDLNENRFVANLNHHYFAASANHGLMWSECPIGEGDFKTAPLTFSFIVSDKCPPGEHQISIKFLYEIQGQLPAIADSQTKFKVTSFGERNSNVLMGGLTVMALVAPIIQEAVSKDYRQFVWAGFGAILLITLWLMKK